MILVIILYGRTKARSPATQSFKVGVIKPLLILFQVLRLPCFRSFKVWMIGLPSPKTLAIWAMLSPYSLVLVTGSVKFTLEIKAKLLLFDLISFKAWPLTHIYP